MRYLKITPCVSCATTEMPRKRSPNGQPEQESRIVDNNSEPQPQVNDM